MHSPRSQTDETALYLIGAVGRPIVQKLVDQATLSFSAGNITGVTDFGFSVALSGSLGNTGPFDALIQTPEPGITVTWEGRDIAVIILQDICAFADISVPQLETMAQLTITDLGAPLASKSECSPKLAQAPLRTLPSSSWRILRSPGSFTPIASSRALSAPSSTTSASPKSSPSSPSTACLA